MKSDTEKILTANYNILEFSKNMLLALDNISTDSVVGIADFKKNNKLQKKNLQNLKEVKNSTVLQILLM